MGARQAKKAYVSTVIIPLITLIIDPILLEVFDIVQPKYVLKYY